MTASVRRAVVFAVFVAVVLVLWILLSASGSVKEVVLPPPSDVWDAMRELTDDPGTILDTCWATLRPLLISFAVAAPIGVAMGVLVGRSQLLTEAYEPLLADLYTVPYIILYPLLAGLLGLGALPQIVVGVLAAIFPIAIASSRATREIDSTLVSAAQSMGARGWSLIRTVSLPAAMPGIFTGLRTGLGLAFVTIIAGQFISSTEGLGYKLAETSQAFQTPQLFAWIVVTLVLSAVINAVWALLQGQIERKVRS